jgi:uncharacterized membrane protein YidH (DUF202 family)
MERMTTLAAWESFYVIVGSSAAALTGLQFVVISVVGADPDKLDTGTEEIGAFGTPTVVHFCVTLLVAGLCGIGGLLYTGTVVRRARTQKGYRPVFEDWIWHAVLPAIAYVTLLVASMSATGDGLSALFVIAAAALLLLYVGIHNAWDAVVYIALSRRKESKEHR